VRSTWRWAAVADRLTVEVIRNAAIYASEEMGVVLRNTAYSPNIKDRLDHTCAVLAPWGELVAQAEHIPVHIGSMAVGVENALRALRERGEGLGPGDVVIVNDPYVSGTHLNDIMLLKPVYHGDTLVAIVVNKAHHVDVGGAVPGSIGGARELLEEGIVIPPVKLAEGGRINWDLVRLVEANVRTPRYFRGDLKAQLAALNVGEKRVLELARKYGASTLLDAWREILDYTERYTRARIRGLGVEGEAEAVDYVELASGGEAAVRARLAVAGDGIVVDYDGTGPQVEEPLNAVYGVTVAATVYALKSVIDPEMPVNHGFFRAVEIRAPEGTLVNPRPPAPVGGGNTETSQRIADVVFLALSRLLPGRVPAASCGTMTNVMMGGWDPEGGRWAFYETVGCGQGARPGKDGVDGVHTNMTNTLNTPIERVEAEYPIIFEAYELRPDSEGPGRHRGGLGITRAFRLARGRATLTLLAERCSRRPWGLEGGEPGEPGHHYIVRADGTLEPLPCKATVELREGDAVYINTPGGGGLGPACERPREAVEADVSEGKVTRGRARERYCLENS